MICENVWVRSRFHASSRQYILFINTTNSRKKMLEIQSKDYILQCEN